LVLTDDEKYMLDGHEGKAVQKAMELLVKYGDALGAERFCNVTNVMGAFQLESVADWPCCNTIPSIFSQLGFDSDEILEDIKVKVPSYYNQSYMDPEYYPLFGRTKEDYDLYMEHEEFMKKAGMNLIYSCSPYLCGNLPGKGEHIAWMESSAIAFANGILGARTNCEGCESAYSAMLTGKIPYWGYHITENRKGTHLIETQISVESEKDWGLLGYYAGYHVQEKIPVISGITNSVKTDWLKHFCAAAASSGGVEMFHIPGISAEANTVEEAFGPNKPEEIFQYGKEERRFAYERLNCTGKSDDIDFVVMGCPHYSINQLWTLNRLINGRKIKDNIEFWVFMPRQIRELAKRSGLKDELEATGIKLMTDGCPCMGRRKPDGASVMCTDSAKQAHYMPNFTGIQSWYGSAKECVEAAVSGKWRGDLDE